MKISIPADKWTQYLKLKSERIALEKREKELSEKEDADRRFRETGTRLPRQSSKDDKFLETDSKGKMRSVTELLNTHSGVMMPK